MPCSIIKYNHFNMQVNKDALTNLLKNFSFISLILILMNLSNLNLKTHNQIASNITYFTNYFNRSLS